MTLSRLRSAAVVLFAVALVLGACSSDDDTSDDVSTDDSAAVSEAVADDASQPVVEEVWARTSADGQENGAAYMRITGGAEDDALVGASVDVGIAGAVEVHETVPADDADGAADDVGGMDDGAADADGMDDGAAGHGGDMAGMAEGMTMQPVSAIDVPAGETVVLEPGGYHVMLLELVEPLEEGQTFDLTLVFEEAGEVTVPVEVRDR